MGRGPSRHRCSGGVKFGPVVPDFMSGKVVVVFDLDVRFNLTYCGCKNMLTLTENIKTPCNGIRKRQRSDGSTCTVHLHRKGLFVLEAV